MYQFNLAAPPLLHDYPGGTYIDIPNQNLRRDLPSFTWRTFRDAAPIDAKPTGAMTQGGFEAQQWAKYWRSDYEAFPSYVWKHVGDAQLFPATTTEDITITRGYSRTEHETFEQRLAISLTATFGEKLKVAASASEDSRFAREVIQTWQEAVTVSRHYTFKEGTWLSTWHLVASVRVKKKHLEWTQDPRNPPDSGNTQPTYVDETIDNILVTYPDYLLPTGPQKSTLITRLKKLLLSDVEVGKCTKCACAMYVEPPAPWASPCYRKGCGHDPSDHNV